MQGYTIATCLAASKLGVFEAIPPTGTATAKEVAQTCDAAEELISVSSTSSTSPLFKS
jgi:hypothetical protein